MSVLLAIGEVSCAQNDRFRILVKEMTGNIPNVKHCSVRDWRHVIFDFEDRITTGRFQIEPLQLELMTFDQIQPRLHYLKSILLRCFQQHTGVNLLHLDGVVINPASEYGQVGISTHRFKGESEEEEEQVYFDDYGFVAFVEVVLSRWIPFSSSNLVAGR